MFGPTKYKVVEGFTKVPCLQIETPTGRRATHDGPFIGACTRIYVGIINQTSIGKDARTLGFEDLHLGKFIEGYNEETGKMYFEMELPYAGEYAFVMESNELKAPDGVLYIGTQFTSHSDEVKPPLLYPLDAKPHFKVAEELTTAEEMAGKQKKHYVCTAVESNEGQAPEMQQVMDSLDMNGVSDWDVVEFRTALYFEEASSKVYRSGAIAKGAGGSTRSLRGEHDKHAVIIGKSEHTAVQQTRSSKAKPLSEVSKIKVRMYVRQLEAPTVSEGEVGLAPRIIKRKTSDNVIAELEAQMQEFATKKEYANAATVQTKIAELKKKNDAISHEEKRRKGNCSSSLADEGCASHQRNYMPGATMLLAKSEKPPPTYEVHNFNGSCEWNVQITVKEHDGKDDTVGERVDISNVTTKGNYRCYKVKSDYLIRVTLKNLSLDKKIHLLPVYKGKDGEEPEDLIDIEAGCKEFELPFPLKISNGEDKDYWLLKNELGKTLLTLGFEVE